MKKWYRVDIQVSIFTALAVLIASLSIFAICIQITYADSIRSLAERVDAIYDYLEENLEEASIIEINTKEDMNTELYQSNKALLEQIKDITGVRYLYTAKENEDGTFIYVIDGLSMDEDFRYPGDPIEEDIQEELRRALAGEKVRPDKIKKTDWGNIFITYQPIHKNDEIIGVVGIEFEADHQYRTYKMLQILTPIISVFLCLLAVMIAHFAFRRISNPNFQDMSNTDQATGLKNRNAFDIDIHNMIAKHMHNSMGVISMDLNGLKRVNDALGHAMGDRYIFLVAESLMKHKTENMVLYRTGGDEFVALVQEAEEEDICRFIEIVTDEVAAKRTEVGIKIGVSFGYAIYNGKMDKDLYAVYKRADSKMYQNKKAGYKKESQQLEI